MQQLTSPQQQGPYPSGIKRRSRYDAEGRDFKCHYCDKTYLSMPAMQQHMKNKHYNALATGQPPINPPAYNTYQPQMQQHGGQLGDPSTNSTASYAANGYMPAGRGRGGRPPKNTDYNKVEPTSDIYLCCEGRQGGPVDPALYFNEVYGLILQVDDPVEQQKLQHPLKYVLDKYSFGLTPAPPTNSTALSETQDNQDQDFKQLSLQIAQMSEGHRVMMSCDEIFGVFLREVASKVNENYYKSILNFVILYRDCLNEHGWNKKAETVIRKRKEDVTSELVAEERMQFADDIEQFQFCEINNAEMGPEVCNEFVTSFMDKKRGLPCCIPREEAIDMTRLLSHWLFVNGHTCSKLSMI